MDGSFPEPASGTQEQPKKFLVSLIALASMLKWLAGLITFTEKEQEEAGIYRDRPGGE